MTKRLKSTGVDDEMDSDVVETVTSKTETCFRY